MSKHTTLEQLKLLAQRTKSEISKVESKSLVGVKVNGVALAIADKMVDILIASGATNGTLSVAGKDVAVTVWRPWPTRLRSLRPIWIPL